MAEKVKPFWKSPSFWITTLASLVILVIGILSDNGVVQSSSPLVVAILQIAQVMKRGSVEKAAINSSAISEGVAKAIKDGASPSDPT